MTSEKDGWDIPDKNVANPITESRVLVPTERQMGEYPLIDNDPHIRRVFAYMRPSDYIAGAAVGAVPPVGIYVLEKAYPTFATRGGFARIMRLNAAIGITGGIVFAAMRSALRFYGHSENAREVGMDMREMTDKVKRGESLYGESRLSEYMQGVAHRNTRYGAVLSFFFPLFNFVNHPYHGVDTAKYYRNAELELEGEKLKAAGGA